MSSPSLVTATENIERPQPLVTIGIPAYNRPAGLMRAIKSAVDQDHRELEIIVSDDASPDPQVRQTALACVDADRRVRYVRQPSNLGHAKNYQWVLEAANGDYFMWLSDDDWIDAGYVSACLATLVNDAGTVLACGRGRYYAQDGRTTDERTFDLSSARPGVRVLQYFARVSVNGALFGVARRTDWLATGFPAAVGGDWMLVASMAAQGRVHTVDDVHIHRSASGLGADAPALARSFGMQGWSARNHHAVMAIRTWHEIVDGEAGFSRMRPTSRIFVGTIAGALVVGRFGGVQLIRRLLGAQRTGRLEARVSDRLRSKETR